MRKDIYYQANGIKLKIKLSKDNILNNQYEFYILRELGVYECMDFQDEIWNIKGVLYFSISKYGKYEGICNIKGIKGLLKFFE